MSIQQINQFSGMKTTLPGVRNVQSIPLTGVQHFSPSSLGNTTAYVSSFQLLNGALSTAPSTVANIFTMPTSVNLLAAYQGVRRVVNPGDVFKTHVFNYGSTGAQFITTSITGAFGGFVSTQGTPVASQVGSEAIMHMRWTEVSADGLSGTYQVY